jgi:small-conductance mechanosensitive channel
LKVQDNRALFLLKIVFYFIIFYLILRYYAQVIQVSYDSETSDHQGLGLRQDVIKQCSQIISVSAAFLVALIIAGVDFTSLGVFGGLIGAGLSVALKDMLGNLVAGVLLLWDKTIKKKDVITVSPSDSSDTGGTYAIVEKMTMRYTVVQDRNEVRRLIPNSLLTNSIVENWTHEDNKVRLRVLVGVDYGTDLRLARTILESVCYEVDRVFTKDRYAPKAVVLGFGDYSIDFALRFWIEDAYKGIRPVLSDLYIAIQERFKEENINIPYPRRDLRIISKDGTDRGLRA